VTLDGLRQLDGGRLPIGLQPADVSGRLPLTYQQQVTDTYWRDPQTGRLLDASRQTVVVASAKVGSAPLVLGEVRTTQVAATASARAGAAVNDRQLRATAARAQSWGSDYPTLLGLAALAMGGLAIGAFMASRRRPPSDLASASTTDVQPSGEGAGLELTDASSATSERVSVR
jgi:hypothetical protein